MARLTDEEREARRRKYAGKFMPSKIFVLRRQGKCGACRGIIREGHEGVFRYFEGVGPGELVHPAHLDLVPATVGS